MRREFGCAAASRLRKVGCCGNHGAAMDLLDFLLDRGRIDEVQRERVRAVAHQRGDSDSTILTRLGIVDEREMARLLAEFFAIPLAMPADYPAAPLRIADLSPEFLLRAHILPLHDGPDGLALAMADPADAATLKAVRLAVGKPVLPWAALPSDLAAAMARLYPAGNEPLAPPSGAAAATVSADLRRLRDQASTEPVIRYVNRLIGAAAAARASDIHIEASEDRVMQRLRVDGMLRDIAPPPAGL